MIKQIEQKHVISLLFGRAILENRVFPLKKGYVGVVSRSQSDIETNKCIEKALTGEMISGFVPSQLKEARLLANFRFISTTPTELGAAVLTFVRHDMD